MEYRLVRVRPRVYRIEPRPEWCLAILNVDGVGEVLAKRINADEVSLNRYIGYEARGVLSRVIVKPPG